MKMSCSILSEMLLSRTITRINPRCYLGVTSARQFSSVRNISEQNLFRNRNSFIVTYNSNSNLRYLSLSVPKLSEKEELIINVPETPAEPSAPAATPESVFTIPEKPEPVDLSVLGEPSLESLGLASYWPPGRLQYCLELLHVNLDLHWFQCIAVATIVLRLLMFPVVVTSQRNMAHMNNNMPKMAALQVDFCLYNLISLLIVVVMLQEKISNARRRGDMYEMAQLTQELQTFTTKQGINPLKNMLPMAIQVPVFMSFFFGLRGEH